MSNKYQKTNPDGIDKQIQRLQDYIYTQLGLLGWSLHESYERIYRTKKGENFIPEAFISNEYKEVLLDDKVNATSFFLIDDTETINQNLSTVTVSFIIEANIKNLYPSITHRADEEMRSDLKMILKNNPTGFHLKKMITGADNVYQSLRFNIKFTDDMNQFHVVRFDLELNYNINNC
jgi:hypothetical protein